VFDGASDGATDGESIGAAPGSTGGIAGLSAGASGAMGCGVVALLSSGRPSNENMVIRREIKNYISL